MKSSPKNRNKTARKRAALKSKWTKKNRRLAGQLKKKIGGGHSSW